MKKKKNYSPRIHRSFHDQSSYKALISSHGTAAPRDARPADAITISIIEETGPRFERLFFFFFSPVETVPWISIEEKSLESLVTSNVPGILVTVTFLKIDPETWLDVFRSWLGRYAQPLSRIKQVQLEKSRENGAGRRELKLEQVENEVNRFAFDFHLDPQKFRNGITTRKLIKHG